MSDSSMQSATQRVLATPELLESIFFQLPLSDLLIRTPLVCRHFRDTISHSVALQQSLYFAPNTDASRSVPNPLIKNGNRALFVDKRFKLNSEKKGFEKYNWPESPMSDLKPFKWTFGTNHESIKRVEASWRKMLVIQPPVTVLDMVGVMGSTYISEQGVTIGVLGLAISTNYQSFFISTEGRGRLITAGDHG